MPLIGFYGDDFTGSVDALLQLRRAGLDGVLVTGPDVELPAGDPPVVGIAGTARSQPAEAMAGEVVPALSRLADLGPAVVQYKACSTADSSPRVGSLGRVLELARGLFPAAPVPVVFAQPAFGRYTCFSHHFARDGEVVYRIDRQPTMRNHPVTPATESDLRLHLGAQTGLPVRGLHWPAFAVAGGVAESLDGAEYAAVVCDALTEEHLDLIAAAVLADPRHPRFTIASGGLSGALGRALDTARLGPLPVAAAPATGPVLVASGSRSALTRRQVDAALRAGWSGVDISGGADRACDLLAAGRDVVVDAARSAHHTDSAAISAALADIAEACLRRRLPSRLVLCGGDTSGNVLRRLGVTRITLLSRPWGDVPLCLAAGPEAHLDGVEIVLKGGQLGHPDLFEDVRLGRGHPAAPSRSAGLEGPSHPAATGTP